MAGIQEFIQMTSQNLGVSENAVKPATAAILGTLRKEAAPGDFEQLLAALPGASDLLGEQTGEGKSGGLLGGLMQHAGAALGGGIGTSAGLLGMLQGTGLRADQFGPFVSLFLQFVQSKAGKDLVGRLLARAPELAKLAG